MLCLGFSICKHSKNVRLKSKLNLQNVILQEKCQKYREAVLLFKPYKFNKERDFTRVHMGKALLSLSYCSRYT